MTARRVATPSAANKLLQTLSYRSIATDVRDVVSVEVFDGVGGECLHEHTTASIRDGCFRRNASLTIYVASYALFEQHASARDKEDRRWAKKYGWPYSAFAGLFLSLLACCCCARCCCRRRTSDDGAVVKKSGSCSASPKPFTVPSTVAPSLSCVETYALQLIRVSPSPRSRSRCTGRSTPCP